ncbi:Fe-S cluster-containing hydrogenase [Paraliomyxa miuraensis]|uniref:Fe-S cluster-containing hydrogenase n=1 Tax=Paraliomyxa miuraensis TaxID=376150 RepID=UPI002254A930|nr:Fe-S cluster-containing hydrogenase [Paraliomyxa miuraensis]MCX4239861.1 Fe-S cluster-containing hydrogenase [Paraliomyxa miuraensis]
MRDLKAYRHGYWRSLEHRALSHDEEADSWKEFPPGAAERPAESLSRRKFFGVMGASAALAGATATTGCIRKPKENILPFSERPEDLIPGKPLYYSTAVPELGSVLGVMVESQDGRPTKIEGNPRHPGSQGAASVFAQASVLDLYDPDRTRLPLEGEEIRDWTQTKDAVSSLVDGFVAKQGQGLALVLRQVLSPTQRYQLAQLRQRLPQARVFVDDPMAPAHAISASEMVGGAGARSFYSLADAKVVFAADADFLGLEIDHVRLTREWSRTRRLERSTDEMSRLYVVESHLTGTGTMADHRLRMKASHVGDALIGLAKALEGQVSWPSTAQGVVAGLPEPSLDEPTRAFVKALAKDLVDNKGKGAVLVGERQPVWVHALGSLINAGLGNNGNGQRWLFDRDAQTLEPVSALAAATEIEAVLCFDTNPAFDTPASLGLGDKLAGLTTVHFGLYRDETGKVAKWHIPVSHWLEAWGDLQAIDGTVSIQQPLIAPLHDTWSITEWLGLVASGSMLDGFSVVKFGYAERLGGEFSDKRWNRWVHDGVVSGIPREPVLPVLDWKALPDAVARGRQPVEGIEIDLHWSPKVGDGSMGNNGWMQELPHPITKLTWDNAALLSAATAAKQGVRDGDLLTVTIEGRSLTIPAFVAPGQAEDTISINIGYGHTWGAVAKDVGFDTYQIHPLAEDGSLAWFAGGSVAKAGGSHLLVSTQDYGRLKPPSMMGFDYPERPIVLEATKDEWTEDPEFVEKANLMPPERLHHLFDPPKLTGKQQWGMSIDLNACTGCNACVVACQAENNIPIVGKKQVSNGREMHWIRIDRYFRGDEDNPTAVVQPMACQHCEAAPCETVCPVAATTHSPEGLNDMAYNRCIGTRYCSNNCPYKVRRYNFFNYNIDLRPGSFWTDDPDGARLRQLQKNPDVTIRFRGVMEKCTYCVQRINQAKIEAHVAGQDKVADGVIVTACQQTCPAEAIMFGDVADPESAVSKAKANSRDYQVLRDLNNAPRTSYLARIRNPNPELV